MKPPLRGPGVLRAAVLLVAAAAFSACGSLQITRNPSAELNSVRKVAVLPFAETPAQKRIAGEWETLLLSLGYRVMERGSMERILGEQGLSVSGLVNPSDAPRIGALLGVDGIVFGKPNPREPYHSYTMAGKPRISEPPPVSVKLVETGTARVVWNLSSEKEKTLQVSREGRAVDGALRKALAKMLDGGAWRNAPGGEFYRETGAAVLAFNPGLRPAAGMRVGIYPFLTADRDGDGGVWADKFAGILIGAGYDAVDRQNLEKILQEQKISLKGAIRPEDIIKMGKLAGLRGIVFGSVYGGEVCAYHAKLVDVETGELYWSAYGEDCSLDQLSGLIKE